MGPSPAARRRHRVQVPSAFDRRRPRRVDRRRHRPRTRRLRPRRRLDRLPPRPHPSTADAAHRRHVGLRPDDGRQRAVLRLPPARPRPVGPARHHRDRRPRDRHRRDPGHAAAVRPRVDRADVGVDPDRTGLRLPHDERAGGPLHLAVRPLGERRVHAGDLGDDRVRTLDGDRAAVPTSPAAVATLGLRIPPGVPVGVPARHPHARFDRRCSDRRGHRGVGPVGAAGPTAARPRQSRDRRSTPARLRRDDPGVPDPGRERREDRHVQPTHRDLDPRLGVVPRPPAPGARVHVGQGGVLRRDRPRRRPQRADQRDDRRRPRRPRLVVRPADRGRCLHRPSRARCAVGRRDQRSRGLAASRPRRPARRLRGQPGQQHHHRGTGSRGQRQCDLAVPDGRLDLRAAP